MKNLCKEKGPALALGQISLPPPSVHPSLGSMGYATVQACLRLRAPESGATLSAGPGIHERDSWALVKKVSAHLVWNASAAVIKDST